jgi:hypothetical protein
MKPNFPRYLAAFGLGGTAMMLVLIYTKAIKTSADEIEDPIPISTAPALADGRERLWWAVCAVESGGNPCPPPEPAGEIGIAQILPIMVEECNRIDPDGKFTLADRWSPERSHAMFDTYLDYWTRGRSTEWQARSWNGGPGWEDKPPHVLARTARYWRDVQERLRK